MPGYDRRDPSERPFIRRTTEPPQLPMRSNTRQIRITEDHLSRNTDEIIEREDDPYMDARLHSSAIPMTLNPINSPRNPNNRGRSFIPAGAINSPRTSTRIPNIGQHPQFDRPRKQKTHWLVPVGITMLALIALGLLGANVVAWARAKSDDLQYGYPRTAHYDQIVGHGKDDTEHPSHFMAINLNRHVVVLEFIAGNPEKSISYTGPYLYGPDGDRTPVTLEFRDLNKDGKSDMIMHIQDQVVVFINDKDKFRPLNANDNIHL